MTSTADPDPLGHRLAMRLRAAYARLRRHSNLAFAAFGMTSDQYVLLNALAEEGEGTQQELVRRCDSDTSTIGTMLTLLEAKGLVVRCTHEQDGRSRSVLLTPAGRILAKQMWRGSCHVRADLVALFDEKELQTLLGLLERLAGAMPPPTRKPSGHKLRRSRLPKRAIVHPGAP